MPYAAEISRSNPTCFLFLVDQSGSMAKPFGGRPGKTKAQGVADAINGLLQNLVLKSTKSEGIRDYFRVGVLGYGATVGPAFGGDLVGQGLIRIKEIADRPLRVEERVKESEDGAGGTREQKIKFPIWFEPIGEGRTPMCRALTIAREIVSDFLKEFPASYPPLLFNISDGMGTDGSPEPIATSLKNLASKDGNLLLFNAHLSSHDGPAIEFPDKESALPNDYARMLFRMSSLLPAKMLAAARNEGLLVPEDARGFAFNADLACVIRFMDIGTVVTQTLSNPPKNFYEVLQVSPSAEPEVIAAAYRGLACKYHPDRNSDPSAQITIRLLNEAHEVLSDPARRKAYDQKQARER